MIRVPPIIKVAKIVGEQLVVVLMVGQVPKAVRKNLS